MAFFKQKLTQIRDMVSGPSTKTTDPHLDAAEQDFRTLLALTTNTKKFVQDWAASLKAYVMHSHKFAQQYSQFFNVAPPDGPHPRYTLAQCNEAAHSELLNKHLVQMDSTLENTIYNAIDVRLQKLQALKSQLADREGIRSTYDHYQDKTQSLRTKRDKLLAQGKAEKPQDKEKRERNEMKLDNARKQYEAKNEEVINALRHEWDQRFVHLDPIFVKVLEMEKYMLGVVSTTLSKIVPERLSPEQIQHVKPQQQFSSNLGDQTEGKIASPRSPGAVRAPPGPPRHEEKEGFVASGGGGVNVAAVAAAGGGGGDNREVSGEAIRAHLKPGMECQAQYSDGSWYAARVDGPADNGLFLVTYTEYNDQEAVTVDRIKIPVSALPPPGSANKQARLPVKAPPGPPPGARKIGPPKLPPPGGPRTIAPPTTRPTIRPPTVPPPRSTDSHEDDEDDGPPRRPAPVLPGAGGGSGGDEGFGATDALAFARDNPEDARAAMSWAQNNQDEAREVLRYAQDNPEQTRAALNFANENRDAAMAAARYANENRDQARAAASFASNNAGSLMGAFKK